MTFEMEKALSEVRATGCDATNPSIYSSTFGKYICRCLVCARCNRHTGNNTQGHYWKLCKVQAKFHSTHKNQSINCKECMPDFHQCCPGDCELYNEDGSSK